uniref:Protein SDA1 n=1 Tax=Panagrolaimus sp. JU765 TaxID=591449 RepID=A0AC34R976_9BILA
MATVIGAPQGRYAALESQPGLLQEMIRKDPASYKEEFEDRFFKFQQRIKLFDFNTALHRNDIHAVLDLVTFLSGVAAFYPEHAKEFAKQLSDVLKENGPGLDNEIRLSFVKALVTLRNKKVITDSEVFDLFFDLVRCEDKNLRKFILGALISFIKQLSQKCPNKKYESNLQNLVISRLKDSRAVVARIAQLVLIDAFRKKYWRVAKIANAIAECVFHKVPRLQVVAMRFFLGSLAEEEGLSDDSDEEEEHQEQQKNLKEVMNAFKAAKKTKKRIKNLEKTKKLLTKDQKAKKESRSKFCNLEALNMLFDPQTFCDRLFGLLEGRKNEKFIVRLQQIALCARIIGVHRLQVLGFYSFMHRYLQPKQREVTRLLLYVAQACHELVPPDYVQDVVRVIANNFVTDRNTPEGMTVGINAIREIFTNCPFAATEELLRELSEFKSYKNKNVSMAARGLISIFRTINPKLLAKKDRGRPTVDVEENLIGGPLEFGKGKTVDYVPGAEVLPDETDEEAADDGTDEDSDSEWETVAHDDDEVDVDEEIDENDDEFEDVDESDEEMDDEDEEGWVTASDEEEESDEDADEEEEGEEDADGEEDSVEPVEKEKPKKLTRAQYKVQRRALRSKNNEVNVEKAKMISETRILTDADFKKIRVHQLKKRLGAIDSRKRTNADFKLEEELESKKARKDGGDGLTKLNDIVHFYKKLKTSKEEKIRQAQEGKESRDTFTKPKKNGPHVGRNNKELAKHKPHSMVRQKVRGKNRQRSFRDRQKSLRNYLLRQAGRKPGNM